MYLRMWWNLHRINVFPTCVISTFLNLSFSETGVHGGDRRQGGCHNTECNSEKCTDYWISSGEETITLEGEMYSCLKISLKATDMPMKLSLQNEAIEVDLVSAS